MGIAFLTKISRRLPWHDQRSDEVLLARARQEHQKFKATSARLEKLSERFEREAAEMKEARLKLKQVRRPHTYVFFALLPARLAGDFLTNLETIFTETWVPRYGYKKSRWLWHRNCWGLVAYYWFDTVMLAAERIRKVIW
ncbi:hypothetical protein [Rhizobium aethiopicum]|nr:hypothetical protein [Rhizobium aethiopicum]